MSVSNLEAAGLVAAMAVFADKTAAPFVATPHLAPHRDSDVTSPSTVAGAVGLALASVLAACR
jgi:hypothetical protein